MRIERRLIGSRLCATTLLFGLCLALAEPVFANDSEYGNSSGMLAPVKNDDIRMVSEDITFEHQESGLWKVDAKYVFENTTDEKVSLTMGFPEFEGYPSEFLKFKTRVRGKPVALRTAKSAPANADAAWKGMKGLGRVHLFELEFKPRERLEVEHLFAMKGGNSVAIAMEHSIDYVTRTGAMWKGPIGRARFTIRTRQVYELIAWSPTFEFQSLKRFVVEPGVATGMELVLENENWTPTEDLAVDFLADMDQALRHHHVGGECPDYQVTDWKKFNAATGKEREKYVFLGDLSKYDPARLRLCRNWIYARYGYSFRDPALRKRFYGKVHLGSYPPEAAFGNLGGSRKRRLAPLMPDPNFKPEMLTVEEMKYVKALRAEERRRKAQKKKGP